MCGSQTPADPPGSTWEGPGTPLDLRGSSVLPGLGATSWHMAVGKPCKLFQKGVLHVIFVETLSSSASGMDGVGGCRSNKCLS